MPLLTAILLGLAIAAPLLAVSIALLAPRASTCSDERARRLRRSIRRWRAQRAAQPELAAMAKRWEAGQ